MAINKQDLIEKIQSLEALPNEDKSTLIKLLREHKKYGIVWEDKQEDVEKVLETEIPVLTEVKEKDIISNDPSAPNHILIEGENLHALTALSYTHLGKVDLIYIDPPYNSGARDWKYNNDYVDGNDSYRHSKWLSLICHRLRIAKKLLKPDNSVLIVTIDEKEFLHLGCLLEDMFPTARIQMVSSVINTAGATRQNEFARTDEYLFFVYIGEAKPQALLLDREWLIGKNSNQGKITWDSLKRAGSGNKRSDSPGCFYPIYVSEDGKSIVEVGEALPWEIDRKDVDKPLGTVAIWPMHAGNIEGRWQTSPDNLRALINKGFVKLGKFSGDETMAISYLKRGEQQKVESGFYKIVGHRDDGSIIVDSEIEDAPFLPGTQWNIPSHNAKQNGTILLSSILGKDKFPFPKSLYAVHDALRFFVADKPEAVILDFFAGSGTTLHATMELNKEDGGKRQCILVTNNENNICEEVTYERNKRVIQGYTTTKGQWVEGLSNNNLRYFKIDFLPRPATNKNKRILVAAATGLFCIKNNVYNETRQFLGKTIKTDVMRYFDNGKNKMLVIYDERAVIPVSNMLRDNRIDGNLLIYVFSNSRYAYDDEFLEVADKVSLCAVPYAIYDEYNRVIHRQRNVEEEVNTQSTVDGSPQKEDTNDTLFPIINS